MTPAIVAHVRSLGPVDRADDHTRTSWLESLDARAKVVGVFAFIIVTALVTSPVVVAAALSAAIVFAIGSRVPLARISRGYLAALPLLLLASVSMFLIRGAEMGMVMLARTSACVLPLIVLAGGADTYDLFAGLRRLGLPAVMANLLMLTHKYILLLSDEFSRMTVARKARGFSGGRSLLDRYGLKVISFTAGMVLVRASWKAERAYDGLRSKAYSGDMTVARARKMTAADIAFAGCFIAVSGIMLGIQTGVLT